MDEQLRKFRVGVVVLATILITLILVLLFGGVPSFLRRTYTVHIEFEQAPGVSDSSPVRKSGILIGRVTDVRFADDGGVIVTAEIHADVKLRRSEICQIKGSPLLGDAVLQFVPSGKRSDEYIQDGDTLKGIVAADPFEMLTELQANVSESLASVKKTSDAIGEFMDTVNEATQKHEGEIYDFIAQSKETMASFKMASDSVSDLIADEKVRADLKTAIDRLPKVLDESKLLLTDARDSLASINANLSNATGLVEANLKDLRKFTEPLGERGPEMVRRMEVNLQRLDLLTEQMLKFSRALNDEQGTISQLVRNPDLYQNLNQTVTNVEDLTRRLRPIVDNLYIFSDKIARHPESLGVRGAVERRAGIK